MNLTPLLWAARKREDRRPLYRRIFTHRRLDILHKKWHHSRYGMRFGDHRQGTVYAVYIVYPIVTAIMYTSLHLSALYWDSSSSALHTSLICFEQMNLPRFMSTLSSRWEGIFLMGVAAGAGFELFKIYFSFRGVNYFSVYKKKQLQKELDEFEKTLKDLDDLITKGVPRTI